MFAISDVARGERPIDFHRDVRPILSDKCYQCHGPDKAHREADLRLDVAPGGELAAIVPGKPDESELIRRITSSDPHLQMPPPKAGKELKPSEVAVLRRWIQEGAKWSIHWAWTPPIKHADPPVKDPKAAANWIDQFLLARLEREGLNFTQAADRVTLIRRLSFDLRGLPPTPEEVHAFVKDAAPDAVEKLIDRYLASDAFGERMAMYWLDLVRFADTVGYHGDQEHHISPYRDWVIDAFIADMPFDEFTRAQLAGDLLREPGTDDKIASGYNRVLQTSHEGGVQEKEYLAMYAADRVRNLSAVWFGGTIGCAQCHNHKFDPYTQKDYYSLVAFFADLDEAEHLKKGDNVSPTMRAPVLKVHTRREREKLAGIEAKIARLNGARPGEDDAELQKEIAGLEAEKAAIEQSARLTMVSAAIPPRTIRLLPRGNWMDETGPIVEPAVPEFLGKLEIGDRRATRLDLANWLTDHRRGAGLFTARVMANRFWYLLFGSGLSRSLEDFGAQGEVPDHPELLDRLAFEFAENGWRIKPVIKRIAMSRAYQQSSESTGSKDPENRLFARQGRFRLPAEVIRDNALAVSGLLVHKLGGPSVHPYQPAGYYQYLNFPKRDYTADADSRQWRRGLYIHWQRQFLHPMLKALDAPRREECVVQRSQSNTPLAALALLNDPTFIEAARVFASRLVAGGATDDERLDSAFEQALSRRPDDAERAVLKRLLLESRREFASGERSGKLVSAGIAPLPKDQSVEEIAAWTMVARAILNLSEAVTRH